MPKISVVTPCYNEAENVVALVAAVRAVFEGLGISDYEHIFIDNASKDRTVMLLEAEAKRDQRLKVIVNARNFGHLRSPFHGLLASAGEATIMLAADFQDPPELIPALLEKWHEGFDLVAAIKTRSEEAAWMYFIRKRYYDLVDRISDVRLAKNFTGFGLYDRRLVDALRSVEEPYPYLRGLVFELTDSYAEIEFTQPRRKRGLTKNNVFTLFDLAMLGICSHSKVPLRLATVAGFGLALLSLLVALGYFAAKLIFWDHFTLGLAPLVIGLFFFASVQLIFLGVIGEYVGLIFTKVSRRPLVIERRRINF